MSGEPLTFVCSACDTPLRFTVDTMGRIMVEPCGKCKKVLEVCCSACDSPLDYAEMGNEKIEVDPCTNCIEQIVQENLSRLESRLDTAIHEFRPVIEV